MRLYACMHLRVSLHFIQNLFLLPFSFRLFFILFFYSFFLFMFYTVFLCFVFLGAGVITMFVVGTKAIRFQGHMKIDPGLVASAAMISIIGVYVYVCMSSLL